MYKHFVMQFLKFAALHSTSKGDFIVGFMTPNSPWNVNLSNCKTSSDFCLMEINVFSFVEMKFFQHIAITIFLLQIVISIGPSQNQPIQ